MENPQIEVVLDINVYVDAVLGKTSTFPEFAEVPPKSGNYSTDTLSVIFDHDKYRLYLSPHILLNLQKVLLTQGVKAATVEKYLAFLLELAAQSCGSVIEPPRTVSELNDHEDNYILDLVKAVDAKFLVTWDNELLDESPWNGRLILDPKKFINRHLNSLNTW